MRRERKSRVPGAGEPRGPFPAFLFLALAWWAPLLPGQAGGAGNRDLDFSLLFSQAVQALPAQRVVTSNCGCSLKEEGKRAYDQSLSLLRRAWRCPGASSKVLDLLARDLVVLARVKGDLVRGKGFLNGTLSPRFRLLLGRIQCAVKIVQWELEKRAGEEGRPRPPSSPLTEYVSRLLDLAFLSPEAGAITLQLLSERGVPRAKRACYLRRVHLAYLEDGKTGKEDVHTPPWWKGIREALGRRARANRVVLEEERGRRPERKPLGKAGCEVAPLDWKELQERWKDAGKQAGTDAFRERERMVTAFLAETEDVEAALQGADLFYRAYPGFCSLGPRGWPNLAWKETAVPAILRWIRARWKEPAYKAAVTDALQGLWIGGGLVRRGDRILVENFMVEIWKEEDLPFPIRARALLCIARSVTLHSARVRKILIGAYVRWKKTRETHLKNILLRAIGVFLGRNKDTSASSPGQGQAPSSCGLLEKAFRHLSGRKGENERKV